MSAAENLTYSASQKDVLLSVRDLQVEYRTSRGAARAVDGVSFDIHRNEVFGLAGESGCGKSTIAHALIRLHKPPAVISGGQVLFKGTDMLSLDARALQQVRWEQISFVSQSAMNALNPVMTIGEQIIDAIQAHRPVSKADARARARELLDVVGIDGDRIKSYPHQLSGGMRQRAVIAIALALKPELIIMDEPTTALDVVVQKQIMEELQQLKDQFGFSVLFITHDLSLLVEFSDRIAIMYAGEIVEMGPSRGIFTDPQHPYTQRLMRSFPSLHGERRPLLGIPGSPPDLLKPPTGCRFHPRCDVAIQGLCREIHPSLTRVSADHDAACHLVTEPERDSLRS